MDALTIATYDAQAAAFAAAQRDKQPAALHNLLLRWFRPAAPTADIGCGSGRDTAWLNQAGFPTVGYDASLGMLAAARAAYPQLDLRQADLPELVGIADAAYNNVLCSAVLMHLPAAALVPALAALRRILAPAGRLVLTYRASQTPAEREPDGRLYTALAAADLLQHCHTLGLSPLFQSDEADGGRPGVTWSILVTQSRP